MEAVCCVDGCGGPVSAKMMCNKHYLRTRRNGDPKIVHRQREHASVCSIEGCGKPFACQGYCNTHYERWRRHGDATRQTRNPNGAGYLDPRGYRRVSVGGKIHFEHRLVMREVLGRDLLPGERVHHVNGDRADNRPENLELWSETQPSGQRVVDKVAWAKEILALYEPSSLAG